MMNDTHSTDTQILIVEDELILAEDVRGNLTGLGYGVPHIAVSGEEAVRKADEIRPNLVLMDIKLQGEMDGIEAAKQIRTRFDIPVVYMTAFSDNTTVQQAKITEPFGYIIKPVDTRELHATVEMALYRHRLESRLKESERWLDTTLRSIGDGVIATDGVGRVVFMNPVAEGLTGWKQAEAMGRDLSEVFRIVDEVTRETPALSQAEGVENPVERVLLEDAVIGLANHTILIRKDGVEIPIDDSGAPIRDDDGTMTGVVLTFRDITERVRAEAIRRQAEEERLAHLYFLESMERINRAIQQTSDLEQVMRNVLETTLSIFECDRAWLLYPCDPDAPSWRVPMECTRPEYPGALAMNVDYAITPDVARDFQKLLDSEEPLTFEWNPGDADFDPRDKFAIRSAISLAIYPKTGQPWDFGLHQCSHTRIWTEQQQRLFKEIGRRIADALSSLLLFQSLRDSEERYRSFVHNFQGIAFRGRMDFVPIFFHGTVKEITGYTAKDIVAGKPRWDQIVHPDDLAYFYERVEQARLAPDQPADVEHRIVRKDGQVRWIHQLSQVAFDDSGKPLYVDGVVYDITERVRAEAVRRQTEEALRESEERYRTIFETTGVSIWEEDFSAVGAACEELQAQGVTDLCRYLDEHPEFVQQAAQMIKVVDVNETTVKMFGATSKANLLGPLDRIMLPETLDIFREEILALAKGLTYFEGETVNQTLDGKRLNVLLTMRIPTEAKKLDRVLVSLMDITKRKRAEEALRESEERYRRLIETSPDAITVTDLNGKLVMANQRNAELHGCESVEELMGLDAFELIVPADRQRAMENVHKTLETGGIRNVEYTLIKKDGTHFLAELSASVLVDSAGNPTAFLGVVRDITERVRAEEALRESEKKYRSLIEQSNDAICLLYENRFELVNPKFTELFGVTPEEARAPDFDFMSLVAPQSRPLIKERARELAQGQEPIPRHELTAQDKEGHEIEIDASVSYVPYRDGTAIQSIVRDVTERKRLEKKLHQHERLAAVGQLAAGIAHDFRNLLTTVILYANMALQQPELPSKLTRNLGIIISESKKAADLVQQILDFSSRAMIQPRPLDLESFIAEVTGILRRTIPENIRLTVETKPEPNTALYIVEADPTRIQQILMNLATNARDAMPEGGELRFELSRIQLTSDDEPPVVDMPLPSSPLAEGIPPLSSPPAGEPALSLSKGIEGGQWVCLAVSDTGTGMTEKVRAHLFEPFFTTKEVGKGTGLGLAQVYGIVRQHDGYIGIESEVGKGTTFRIYLPAAGTEAETVEKEVSDVPQGRGETVLLVEDDEHLREAGQDILESLGYRVLVAVDGREALRVYQAEEEIDLVITDIVMPEMGGKELVQELIRADASMKAIGVTGYTVENVIVELREAGFLDVIHKPFDIETLARVIRRALDAG